MTPVETTDSDIEPAWDHFGINRCDFRPQWDGDLVNVFTTVLSQGSSEDTEMFMKKCARAIAAWVVNHSDEFGPEDRFQVIVGWPKTIRETGRQVIKVGGTYENLRLIAAGETEIELRKGWSVGVFS